MGAVNIRNPHGHVIQERKGQIVHGTLRPGDAFPCKRSLAELALAAISRTALCEVIRVLFTKGLIKARPKVGTRIREERPWHQIGIDAISLFFVAETTLLSYFVFPVSQSSGLKYSLPYHHKVFEPIERLQPGSVQRAVQQTIPESHANVTGKHRIWKPV